MTFFKFCLNDHTRNLLKIQCKKSKSGCKLYIGQNEFILVDFRKLNEHFYVKINLKNLFVFFDYVIKNKLFCNDHNHKCKLPEYYIDYINLIINNQMLKYLRSYVHSCVNNFGMHTSVHYVFKRIYKYSPIKTINLLMEIKSLEEEMNPNDTSLDSYYLKIIQFNFEMFKKYFHDYFTKNEYTNNSLYLDFYTINYKYFLKKIY
ncbi:hypothetical protein QLL95_gp0484 [Cotonvirus japonicus]|uniref:Uncharacterized protein n=1 Tax=Cotonvirus japonicus TaxID=2811091 RepID=A0ABM7NU32_9VIRU|nr:hypothetical protein QLL95_gp0484 [Cotonvirus japonicus]BCS83639.1 hypothetical protein [Cotonvirus japonicus]